MAVLVGIDEAGFGPILGPLVVSSSVFSLPDNHLKADLWQVLRKSVDNKRKKLAGRLLITDSKKAYNKLLGIKHLERTVLACIKCLGSNPTTLVELLKLLCSDCVEQMNDYPWYKDAAIYAIPTNCADLTIASAVLKDDLDANQIKLLEIRSCCLDVAYFNKMVSSVKNKAQVLFIAVSRLIQKAYDNFPEDDMQIIVDRQGGRVHYRNSLQQMFPDMELKILKESPETSSYQLQQGSRRMSLHFVVKADEHFLPVSLASMVSKYLRELLIDNINRYFTGFHSGLKPTAGYWKDGLRFIEDLKKYIPNLAIDENQLVRCR